LTPFDSVAPVAGYGRVASTGFINRQKPGPDPVSALLGVLLTNAVHASRDGHAVSGSALGPCTRPLRPYRPNLDLADLATDAPTPR